MCTYLIRRVGDESLVVTDTDHTALERLERVNQGIDTLDIQVVRGLQSASSSSHHSSTRLIEQQDVRPLHRQHRKCYTRLLTSGQRADLLQTR